MHAVMCNTSENILSFFIQISFNKENIVINSTPSLWHEEAEQQLAQIPPLWLIKPTRTLFVCARAGCPSSS